MKVTLDAANSPTATPANLPRLQIDGVTFSSREASEKFVRHVKAEIELLWPVKK